MCLQLAAQDDWTAGVEDGIAGMVLGGAWVVANSRSMIFSTQSSVGVHLKAIDALGVQHISLIPRGLEVLHEACYHVHVRRLRIRGEAFALMRRIGNVRHSALLEEVELSHDGSIVETLVESRGGGIRAHDPR